MAFTFEQIEELKKLKKFEKQYEGIIRTSVNGQQQQRAKIDLKKIKDRINEIDPKSLYTDTTIDSKSGNDSGVNPLAKYSVLSMFQLEKASPNCTDLDINLMHTIIYYWEKIFMIALGDKHVKLDFSLNAEREAHYPMLTNLKRYHKAMVDTIEDHAKATREDAKNQLADMKRRYGRQFLNDGVVFLRKVKEFWDAIDQDIKSHGIKCNNARDHLSFDLRFEEESFLKGSTNSEVIAKSVIYLAEGLSALRLPEIPKPGATTSPGKL